MAAAATNATKRHTHTTKPNSLQDAPRVRRCCDVIYCRCLLCAAVAYCGSLYFIMYIRTHQQQQQQKTNLTTTSVVYVRLGRNGRGGGFRSRVDGGSGTATAAAVAAALEQRRQRRPCVIYFLRGAASAGPGRDSVCSRVI